MHPIHIYNAFKLIVTYLMHSVECIHTFLRKQMLFMVYLVDQTGCGYNLCNLTSTCYLVLDLYFGKNKLEMNV